MDETFTLKEQTLTIKMPEEVDHHQAVYISEIADMQILKGKVTDIVFDFSDTAFMDSSGIGILVGRYKKLSCIGGKVYVSHVGKRMEKMFYMSGLLSIVEMINGE